MNPENQQLTQFAPKIYRQDDPERLISGIVNWRMSARPHVWRPPTDIYETEDRYVVRVEISGMRDGEFSVTLVKNTLIISGVRSDTGEKRAYHQMEIHFGDFSIEVEFPNLIETNLVEANYDDGFLRVNLPKFQPRQIDIRE